MNAVRTLRRDVRVGATVALRGSWSWSPPAWPLWIFQQFGTGEGRRRRAALSAVVPRRWLLPIWLVVVLNGFTRIYVGAHNPLDVVGGTGLGLVIGGPLYAWLASPDPAEA